ncbi:5'-nucleotidase /3'-nucleotidase /exopolyphosphatase [Halobiforma haloterrestris]|uniref:5'-nucleotidase SurE n=1 Tax=Natronobacterium haloterrestre TaxID=148448 RepID=A0A1I1DKC4_NATHA|nr:5'/3'-nucleotidase SurE [Halobiforma haloterrestris]SFB74886.1 5'-nucleotidase /3'-nucleotidase /exopolyphosphatase [Halobiforma haloterrestris]
MDSSPEILLTNDDGIDAPGIRALYDALSEVGSVTVVAPDRNRSAVGRALTYGRTSDDEDGERDEDGDGNANRDGDADSPSNSPDTNADAAATASRDGGFAVDIPADSFTSPVPHVDHELGYAVDGTPCDCAIVGVNAIEPNPDIVVSGCNAGANLGAYVLSRSGTVSAAMEAAFLGVPSIAVSMDTLGYERAGDNLESDGDLEPVDFERAAAVTASIVESAPGTGLFDRVDYLNVNVPRPDRPIDDVSIVRPTEVYEMDATMEDGRFRLTNRLWQQMANRDIPDPPDTDRHALLEDELAISPLVAPYELVDSEPVRRLLEDAVSL